MPDPLHRCIVVGVGNRGRGDDAAGPAVAARLREAPPEGVEIVEEEGEPTALMARLGGADTAFLVDACVSGAPTGTVRRLDVAAEPLPEGAFGMSTHGLGLAEAVEFARALGQLPGRCIVYAIEGTSFEHNSPLTWPVADAVADVAERLRSEIAALRNAERGHA